MPFKHVWTPEDAEDDVRRLQQRALNAGAAQGELIQKAPAPTGWPYVTGFLANSSGHTPAERTSSGYKAEVNVQAEYWPYVNANTHVLERAGKAAMKVVERRMRQ